MTTAQLSALEQINAALDQIQQARAAAMTQPACAERALRLAELADVEAAWWEELSERSRARVHWRAALAAREQAQHAARYWRRRAAAQQEPVSAAQPEAGGQ